MKVSAVSVPKKEKKVSLDGIGKGTEMKTQIFTFALKVNMCSSHLSHSRTVLVELEWNRENQH